LILRRTTYSGIIPNTPNDMSITVHRKGIRRIGPQIRASGMMPAQAIIPNSTTRTLRTGSRQGPRKATAMTRWAKASQSVP
jgi:hypothetical protein